LSPLRVLERILNLRRGDLPRGLLLFTHLFLVIGAYVVGQVARDALFLDRYPAVRLPFVDIGSVLLVGAVTAAYIRTGRRVTLCQLEMTSLLLFAAVGVGLWWLAYRQPGGWFLVVVYLWVGVFGVLAPAQVWTLANYVLSPREAKRLFGLLSGGAVAGALAGGAVAGLLSHRLGVESLLLVVAAGLAAAALVVEAISRLQPAPLAGEGRPRAAVSDGPRSLRESLAFVLRSPALRLIAGLIVVSSFVTSVVWWQVRAMAQHTFVHKEALAPFFGALSAGSSGLALLVQIFVTPRLLRRLELGTLLLILPLGLVSGSIALLATGTLAAATILRVGDRALRYGIDRPAVELLYLPLPPGFKVSVKSFIDTVVWRLGDALAGFAVLALATVAGLGARQLGWVCLVALAVWIALAVFSRGRYVEMLREAIRQHRLDAERASAPVLDRSVTQLLASQLDAVDPAEILYALDLFGIGQAPAHHPAVRGLLRHPAGEVRERALRILNAAGDRTVLTEVEQLLEDPHPGARTEALLYLARHSDVDPVARLRELGDFPDYAIRAAVVAVLARTGGENIEVARMLVQAMAAESGPLGVQTRRAAARLGAALPEPLREPLGRLIQDPDVEVARAAITAVSELDPRPFLGFLIRRLADPRLAAEVASALVAAGDAVVQPLRAALAGATMAVQVRRQIPAILARVGTPAAARVLVEHLFEPDTALRLAVIIALNSLRRSNPALFLDQDLLETAIAAELMGHYRSCQILDRLGGSPDDPASRGLREAMRLEVERVFRLLSLLFPDRDFHSAHVGLESGNAVVSGQALDFLESVLRPDMRRLLLPVIDPDVTLRERARLADRVLGSAVERPEQAIEALAGSHDPWLQSCAAYAIGELGLRHMAASLDAWAKDPDPLLRQTARQAKQRLSEDGDPG
jgi:AAA family ATP:ADP antiporter